VISKLIINAADHLKLIDILILILY